MKLQPLTPPRWPDLEVLFNAKGCSIARGCWCMAYRRSGSRGPLPAGTSQAEANQGKVPVGWISLGPRDDYARLERSPVMKPVDALPVWSIVCFVVPPQHRGQGVARALLDAAIGYAGKHGATLLEGYPVDKPGRSNDQFIWFGAKSMYDAAGFEEVARRKPHRPIVRIRPAG